jgi:FkbM family methyltransferase
MIGDEDAFGMSLLKSAIKNFLLTRGAILSRPPGQFIIGDYKLRATVARGLTIRSAIDGGAADGDWTRSLKEIAPDAQVLMVEPRGDAQPALRAMASSLPGVQVAQVLLGRENRTATFHEHGHQSSMLDAAEGGLGGAREAEMATIDALVERHRLPPPDLIKLDLQGYELEALAGATKSLATAQLVLLEVTFIPFLKGCPLIGDVIPFMSERGFRVYDISGLWHRPLDGALAQGDFVFIRNDHPLIRDPRWDNSGADNGAP